MTETMYHGNAGKLGLHTGLCLADDPDIAYDYAAATAGGYDLRYVHTVELDLDGLRVVEVAGYDRDDNVAPGDGDDTYGADVMVYDDETITGRAHRTWRLMTPAALAALTHTSTTEED